MSSLFLKIVIVGLPFGFSLMWFVYWVVKLYKEKQKLEEARKAAPGAHKIP
jgi:hypothetical protein